MLAFKPMLAAHANLDTLKYPVLGSPKIDGIRCVIHDGIAKTRKLLPIPNHHIRNTLSNMDYNGLDGELIVGHPTDPDVYRKTASAVASFEGEPDFTYYVFDNFKFPKAPYCIRNPQGICYGVVSSLKQEVLRDRDEVEEYEYNQLTLGMEGIMLRSSTAPYKYGRSTVKEGYLLKLKRSADAEAVIVEVLEKMHNDNTLEQDKLGYAKRSHANAGKVAANTAGAFLVRDCVTGKEFKIGCGLLNASEREEVWDNHHQYHGMICKYRYLPYGEKDVPRHGRWIGWRHTFDMSE